MEAKQSRVRWDDLELSRLATAMAPRLLADPGLHPLDAVRAAQACLEPHRQRELKAWSLVEGRLQPKLDEVMARLRGQPLPVAANEGLVQDGGPAPVVNASDEVDSVSGEAPAASEPADEVQSQGGEATSVMPDVPVTSDDAAARQPLPAVDEVVVPTVSPAPAEDAAGESGSAGAQPPEASEATTPQGSDEAAAEPDTAAPAGESLGLFDDQAAVQAEASAHPPARPSRAGRSAAAPVVTPDPAVLEAALLAALQSPAVEDALVDLFSRTMAKALLRTGTGETRPLPAQPPRHQAQRVLLAGFPETEQKALMDALGESFEVRTWKPVNGPQLFHTLARLCRLVVFPEHADEEAEAGLKGMDVRVIRHAGNAGRLIERIGELG